MGIKPPRKHKGFRDKKWMEALSRRFTLLNRFKAEESATLESDLTEVGYTVITDMETEIKALNLDLLLVIYSFTYSFDASNSTWQFAIFKNDVEQSEGGFTLNDDGATETDGLTHHLSRSTVIMNDTGGNVSLDLRYKRTSGSSSDKLYIANKELIVAKI